MKRLLTIATVRTTVLVTTLAVLTPLAFSPAAAASSGSALNNSDISAAKKKKKSAHYYYAPGYQARGAFGRYRSDPSFDPYGRPWRPNFYSTCTEDLGYGRFKSCNSF